jgi:hypothetical protein
VVGTGLWWYSERRPFIGTWTIEAPPPTVPGLANEIEFTFGGAVKQRIRNTTTGEVDYEESGPGRWHVSGGRFQWVANENPLVRFVSGERFIVFWDYAMTWDGPDRIRLKNPSASAPVVVLSRSGG